MNVEPASMNQIRLGEDGRLIEIDRDVGQVAEDLRRIDAGLKVRFAERGECWIVYHDWHSGCPRNGVGNEGSTYLVTSRKAERTNSGVYTGLDQRLVNRIMEIGAEGYDFAGALERGARERDARKKKEREEMWGEVAERGAHALRKDLGARYRGRTFVPRDP